MTVKVAYQLAIRSLALSPRRATALARYAKAKAELDAAAEAQLVALRARRAGGRSTR